MPAREQPGERGKVTVRRRETETPPPARRDRREGEGMSPLLRCAMQRRNEISEPRDLTLIEAPVHHQVAGAVEDVLGVRHLGRIVKGDFEGLLYWLARHD